MKKSILLVFLLLSAVLYAEELDLSTDRYLSAGLQHPYIVPEFSDTKAPCGYKPFYVSHYGRHGCRFQIGNTGYLTNIGILDSLHTKCLLTGDGEKMREILLWMSAYQSGMDGILSQVGSMEHQGIGGRLYKRCPGIFRQKDRRMVYCISSPIQRCIQSNANFVIGLKTYAPDVDVEIHTGDKYYSILAHPVDRTELYRIVNATIDSLVTTDISKEVTCARFFKDVNAAEEVIGKDSRSLIYDLFNLTSIIKCFDTDTPDPLALFTDDELRVLARCYNVDNCAIYSHSVETGELVPNTSGRPILEDILVKADAALKGNDRCADLRFGHDSGVGPLLALIAVEGYDKVPSLPDAYKEWPSWKYLPMGTNFQLIFYRNRKGEVLAKMLLNEKETTIGAVSPFYGPYYRWADLKAYFESRLTD